MKYLSTILLIAISTTFFAQEYNLKNKHVAAGYDVVSYFGNKVKKGAKEFTTTYDGVKFKFSSTQNLETFKNAPLKYIPAYGGYCAYAMGAKGKKVSIDPNTFEIRDGKLYLFYNSWGINTFKIWQEEGAHQLKLKADKNWINIKDKE